MTEQRVQDTKFHAKWVMCPTCRQHTDFENIAYADDGQNETCSSSVGHTNQGHAKCEESMIVQGSYGTKVCFLLMPYHKLVRYWCHSNFILVILKIEAVTRRILWIKHTDPKAKVLVFSSWNDVLDVLEHAFTTNDITYIRMKGGR
jgi:SNF2 family DNA or RNA helicase